MKLLLDSLTKLFPFDPEVTLPLLLTLQSCGYIIGCIFHENNSGGFPFNQRPSRTSV